jgi:hypothetical protein
MGASQEDRQGIINAKRKARDHSQGTEQAMAVVRDQACRSKNH